MQLHGERQEHVATVALRPLFQGLPRIRDWLLGGGTVLTPNRRLARAVLSAWDSDCLERGHQAWRLPRVLPIEEFWLQLWEQAVDAGELPAAVLLDAGPQRRLWREIIEESPGFSLLAPARAAVLCQQAHRDLLLWQLDLDDPALRQRFHLDDDSRCFLGWLERFTQRCTQEGWATPAMACAQLGGLSAHLRRQRLILLDLEDPPPLYRSLFDNVAKWSSVRAGSPASTQAPVIPFPDARSELKAIARWCRDLAKAEPAARIAVVLQDMGRDREQLEMYLRREFDCLTRRYESLPVNFATGLTLDRVPLVADALRVLALGAATVRVEDLLAILQSRFLPSLALSTAPLAKRLDALLALVSEQLPSRVMVAVLGAGEEGVTMPWERVASEAARGRWRQRPRLPSQWLDVFQCVLDAWGWPRGRAFDSLEHQQFEHWQGALEALPSYDPICGDLDYEGALQLLREHVGAQLFQPRTPDAAIQVLGPLETTGLHFDALWLAGMQASAWPAAPRPNPYLPRQLQQSRGMPRADHVWERRRAAQRWDSWLRSTDRLHSSYLGADDDVALFPSPLLAGLPVSPMACADMTQPRWERVGDGLVREPQALSPAPLQREETAASGVGSGVLGQQGRCPFQAFAAQRLAVAPLPEPASGLTAAERGNLLHGALYALFGALPDQTAIQACDGAEREAHITDAAQAALQQLSTLRRDVLPSAALQIEGQRLCRLLRAWLDLEADRDEGFRVLEREAPTEIVLAELPLRLRVDRVDRLECGARLVIDYKSGSPESLQRWFEQPLGSVQLPLYGVLDPPADGVAIACLRPGDMGFRGVGDRRYASGIRDDLESLGGGLGIGVMADALGFWRRELEILARAFVRGEAQVAPAVGACRYCRRESLCRVDEPRR